jgi:hypothetical protein
MSVVEGHTTPACCVHNALVAGNKPLNVLVSMFDHLRVSIALRVGWGWYKCRQCGNCVTGCVDHISMSVVEGHTTPACCVHNALAAGNKPTWVQDSDRTFLRINGH